MLGEHYLFPTIHGSFSKCWSISMMARGPEERRCLSPLPLQADPGGEGEHRAAGGGDREPRRQRQFGQSRSIQTHQLRRPSRLLPTAQRPLHAPTHPAQPGPRGRQTRHHDAGECWRLCCETVSGSWGIDMVLLGKSPARPLTHSSSLPGPRDEGMLSIHGG